MLAFFTCPVSFERLSLSYFFLNSQIFPFTYVKIIIFTQKHSKYQPAQIKFILTLIRMFSGSSNQPICYLIPNKLVRSKSRNTNMTYYSTVYIHSLFLCY